MVARTSFEVIQKDYLVALDWIKGQSKVNDRSRLARYARDLETIMELRKSDVPRNFSEEDFRFSASIYEIAEIIKIHQNLSRFKSPGLTKRIGELASGPDGYIDESSSSNLSRNTQFELYIAAEIAASGYELSLDHERADIVFEADGNTVFVECKRPLKDSGISNCVKDAEKQLRTRYADHQQDSPVYGLIAICADRPINPDFSIMLIDSEEEVNRSIQDMLELTIASAAAETNQHLARDPRTLGALYLAAIPTIVERLFLPTYSVARRVQHMQPDENKKQVELLHNIVDRLRGGIQTDFDRRFTKENR